MTYCPYAKISVNHQYTLKWLLPQKNNSCNHGNLFVLIRIRCWILRLWLRIQRIAKAKSSNTCRRCVRRWKRSRERWTASRKRCQISTEAGELSRPSMTDHPPVPCAQNDIFVLRFAKFEPDLIGMNLAGWTFWLAVVISSWPVVETLIYILISLKYESKSGH